jgi:hypothetical protein
MSSTWDHAQPNKWHHAAGRSQEQSDPLAEYAAGINRLLYAAAAGFVACVVILLIR